ncbi:tripartite tricarboxylate transporter substrate-binding protein [Bradyrhizobium sp. UFLA05-109]
MITKRKLLSLACAGGLGSIMPNSARAQLGQATTHLMVGFGPGGAIDVVARMLAEEMKGHSSFVVENRPGAGGRLVLGALKNGVADGSAMALTPASNLVVFPHVYKSLGYDAFRDFAPVTRVCSFPFLITVGPMVPLNVTTLADFVKWCIANPKQATYGTAAAGSMLHFTGSILAKEDRFEFAHVPYGGPNGIQDLIGGRIAATIYPVGTALPYVRSGSVRALAITSAERSRQLPEVTTVREAGFPALEVEEWFGVVVSAKTPAEAVKHLNTAIRAAVSSDRFATGVAKLALVPAADSPEQFAQLIRSDFDRWWPIVQTSGFLAED